MTQINKLSVLPEGMTVEAILDGDSSWGWDRRHFDAALRRPLPDKNAHDYYHAKMASLLVPIAQQLHAAAPEISYIVFQFDEVDSDVAKNLSARVRTFAVRRTS